MIGQATPAPEPDSAPEAPDLPTPMPAAGDVVAGREYGGRDGPEPTRYGDWEKNGRCIDF